MNHHDVLGVGASADADEIKRAFRQAAQEVHPDHSNSPEAAEAFARIKEARDALLAKTETGNNGNSVASSTAQAVKTAGTVGFTATVTPPGPSAEEIAREQELDRQALAKTKFHFFKRDDEPEEVKRHRKKIDTNNRRMMGKY